jgi:hypothetical protein
LVAPKRENIEQAMCHTQVVSKLPNNKGFNQAGARTGNTFWSKIDSFELSATKVAVSAGRSGIFIAECEHRQDRLALWIQK